MDLGDAWKVGAAVILSLGGGGAIVAAFAKWAGDMLAQRLLEGTKVKYERELEQLKTELEATNKHYQARLEQSILVNRVQFETEFQALSTIWKTVDAWRAAILAIRPTASTAPANETKEEREHRLIDRINKHALALNEMRQAIDAQSPFYPEDIHAALSRLINVGNREHLQVSIDDLRRWNPEWFDQGEENRDNARVGAETVSRLIRQRIARLTVYSSKE